MFKTQLFVAFFLTTLIGGILGISFLRFGSEDTKSYQQLVESSAPIKKGPSISYSQQIRENVCKEVWFREKEPLHFRIHSHESELFFFHDERNNLEVVEEMKNVCCTMQEELFYVLPDGREVIKKEEGKLLIKGANPKDSNSWIDPHIKGLIPMQLVRYFEAKNASYNYNSQLFTAEVVKLWKFRVEGHNPPLSFSKDKPLMSGTAQSVEFHMKGEELNFTAFQLKASFDPKKGAV